MIIRKVSIGPDYKNGAMHYVHGQVVANGAYVICEIFHDNDGVVIYVKNERNEIMKWKKFSAFMPCVVEYNLEF